MNWNQFDKYLALRTKPLPYIFIQMLWDFHQSLEDTQTKYMELRFEISTSTKRFNASHFGLFIFFIQRCQHWNSFHQCQLKHFIDKFECFDVALFHVFPLSYCFAWVNSENAPMKIRDLALGLSSHCNLKPLFWIENKWNWVKSGPKNEIMPERKWNCAEMC